MHFYIADRNWEEEEVVVVVVEEDLVVVVVVVVVVVMVVWLWTASVLLWCTVIPLTLLSRRVGIRSIPPEVSDFYALVNDASRVTSASSRTWILQ